MSWDHVVESCVSIENCIEALERFFKSMCPDESLCEEAHGKVKVRRRFVWVDKIIESGVPDGRSRLILYVISRYLVNIKGLGLDEAEKTISIFIENSCKNHGNCGKIYRSWIRRVLESVKSRGWPPWSLEKIKEKDPQLYDIVSRIVEL
ncbi:MAG: DNA primase noncatalytic subunit PriX [Acidilobaceae archaeon]